MLDTFRRNGVGITIIGEDTLIVGPGETIQAAIDAAAVDRYLDYGILCLHSTPLVANNLILKNHGAGIYFAWAESTGAQAIDNTIVDNDADGIWCYHDAHAIVKNNILTGNTYGIAASHGALPEISFNNSWSNGENYNSQVGGIAAPGLGGLSVDPLFDLASRQPYSLMLDSPCINAGDPSPISAVGWGSWLAWRALAAPPRRSRFMAPLFLPARPLR